MVDQLNENRQINITIDAEKDEFKVQEYNKEKWNIIINTLVNYKFLKLSLMVVND